VCRRTRTRRASGLRGSFCCLGVSSSAVPLKLYIWGTLYPSVSQVTLQYPHLYPAGRVDVRTYKPRSDP
jgi:hypothetical protein